MNLHICICNYCREVISLRWKSLTHQMLVCVLDQKDLRQLRLHGGAGAGGGTSGMDGGMYQIEVRQVLWTDNTIQIKIQCYTRCFTMTLHVMQAY